MDTDRIDGPQHEPYSDPDADVMPGSKDRPQQAEALESLMQRRLSSLVNGEKVSRRDVMHGFGIAAAAVPVLSLAPSALWSPPAEAVAQVLRPNADPTGLGFQAITGGVDDAVRVPDGYQADVLIRWGDPLIAGTPALDVGNLASLLEPGAGELQARRFGYNCDFNGFFPLPHPFGSNPNAGLLAVNHEYTTEELMFQGWTETTPSAFVTAHPEAVNVMKAAHGMSIVEIRNSRDRWRYRPGSFYNRRITADTPMQVTGPAAGNDLLKTSADPSGFTVLGTLNNCAGGVTPWGTVLTCEENFDQYFGNFNALRSRAEQTGDVALQRLVQLHRRIPLPGNRSERAWELIDTRFDINLHPTEPFRFGWVVEIDVYDPQSMPRKRTALGRFKHEGATTVIASNGRAVIYSGDDARFEYVFKFVSRDAVQRNARGQRNPNSELLDHGVLYVARFNDDGSGVWLPLIWSSVPNDPNNPLNPANGFLSQAEVLIDARRAGDVLGATPMDRPEDVEANPVSGYVYVALTNNTSRTGGSRDAQGRTVNAEANASNPRKPNRHGHVIELREDNDDHTSTAFAWDIFLLCGDPAAGLLTELPSLPIAQDQTYFAGYGDASAISKLGAPDNFGFDRRGNLWISTDGQRGPVGINDGVYAVATTGSERGRARQFMSAPAGAEICSPEFNSNGEALFVGIQHPGEGGTLTNPVSDWPDRGGKPPRPSVVAVIKTGPGSKEIGAGNDRLGHRRRP